MTVFKKIMASLMVASLAATMMLSASAAEGSLKFNDLAAEKVGVALGDTSVFSATPERTQIAIVEKDGKKLVSMTGTMGAGDASVRIVSPNGDIDATGFEYLEFYVDVSEFVDETAGENPIPLASRYWTGGHEKEEDGTYYCVDMMPFEGGAAVPWQLWVDGAWQESTDDYGRFLFPFGYKGYVRVDLAKLMESPCGYENNGGPGHIDEFKQIQFVFTLTRSNKKLPIYFGEFNFVDSSVAEPIGLNATGNDKPTESTPVASEEAPVSSEEAPESSEETPVTSEDGATGEVSSEGTANVTSKDTASKDNTSSDADAPAGFPIGAVIGIIVGVVVVAGVIVAVIVLQKKKAGSAK
ncbi:MAG: hypothetical protein IJY82_02645 [Oscillospiraceae bacterium]|nr:hypothetical protein [Oscillospiraceae bacterium]